METAIGVFSSRDHAEEAVKELRQRGVPEQSIVYLTRSENEAKSIAKEFGATVGGFVGGAAGMSAGVVAATLLLPGIGPVFALGFGAAALLGLAGAGAGATVGASAAPAGRLTSRKDGIAIELVFAKKWTGQFTVRGNNLHLCGTCFLHPAESDVLSRLFFTTPRTGHRLRGLRPPVRRRRPRLRRAE